jgi:hypothetical protein
MTAFPHGCTGCGIRPVMLKGSWMSKSKRAWRQRAGVLRSGGPALNTGHSAANPGEHDAVAAPTPRQRFLSPFLQRFLLVFALAMAMLWVVHALAGAPIALGDVLNMITCAVLGSRRGYREAHLSERLLLAYGGLVLLPLALIFGGFSMWMTFGFCAFVTALVWGFCMYQRRQNQRPITVWATLPSHSTPGRSGAELAGDVVLTPTTWRSPPGSRSTCLRRGPQTCGWKSRAARPGMS